MKSKIFKTSIRPITKASSFKIPTYYSQEKDATTANDPTRNVDVLDDADDVNVDAVRLSRLQLQ